MGIYIYKVLAKTVRLTNGEDAHVALFAYKDGWGIGNEHFTSGAARCDAECDKGKRGQWIVRAFKEKDGSLSVDFTARKANRPMGSFTETFDPIDSCSVDLKKLPKGVLATA